MSSAWVKRNQRTKGAAKTLDAQRVSRRRRRCRRRGGGAIRGGVAAFGTLRLRAFARVLVRALVDLVRGGREAVVVLLDGEVNKRLPVVHAVGSLGTGDTHLRSAFVVIVSHYTLGAFCGALL